MHPNTNRIASEGMMRDGKYNGIWKSYYITDILKSEGNYINGQLDSIWVFYTQTGDTAEIINYRLHKKNGYHYQYETVTQRNSVSVHYLKSKELYLDNKLEGPAYYYYPSGKIKQIINFRNGRSQGESKIFDENGTVITIEEYYNGRLSVREHINRVNAQGEKIGTWKTFYPNGKVMEEEFYRNGVLEGSSLLYSERTGNIISGRTYHDGTVIEEGAPITAEPIELTTYYEDGVTIKRKGVYLDSIPLDYHYFYNSSGVPEKVIRYNVKGIRIGEGSTDERGRLTGEYRQYFDTGELRAIVNYFNNLPNGGITYLSKDGKKLQTGYYNNNVREGEWKWFYPSGEIFREETYVDGNLNGLCIQYSDSATIVAKGKYNIEGEREGFWIEHVGYAREEGNYIMGLKNGIWKTYHKDGQLYHTGNFVQGDPDGRHVFYWPNGNIKEEQYYVMGRRDKNWKKYYENGALFLTITYRNDDEIRINGIQIIDARRKNSY